MTGRGGGFSGQGKLLSPTGALASKKYEQRSKKAHTEGEKVLARYVHLAGLVAKMYAAVQQVGMAQLEDGEETRREFQEVDRALP